jgi:hypothetical protein
LNKAAIVTLLIGEECTLQYNKFCKKSVEEYAKKHNFDIFLIDYLIDNSEEKHVAWQKLLIGKIEELKKYETLIWIDSDIVINSKDAPNIIENIPKDRISAVRYHPLLSQPLFHFAHHRVSNGLSAEEFNLNLLRLHNLEAHPKCLINSGVLVIPKDLLHVLENTYYKYKELKNNQHQEQVFLSYELYVNKLIYFLDDRFNAVWYEFKQGPYFFNCSKEGDKQLIKKVLNEVYFLHFAGPKKDIILLEN